MRQRCVQLMLAAAALAAAACSGGGGECLCTPGQRMCNGGDLLVCAESCAAYEVTHCASVGVGYECFAGHCVDPATVMDGDEAEEETPVDDAEDLTEDTADEELPGDDQDVVEEEIDQADGDGPDEEADQEPSDDLPQEEEPADTEPEPDIPDYEFMEFETTLQGNYGVTVTLPLGAIIPDFLLRYYDVNRFFGATICEELLSLLRQSQDPPLMAYYDLLADDSHNPTELGRAFCREVTANEAALRRAGTPVDVVQTLEAVLNTLVMEGRYYLLREPQPYAGEDATGFELELLTATYDYGCQGRKGCGSHEVPVLEAATSRLEGSFAVLRLDEQSMDVQSHYLPLRLSMVVRYLLRYLILPARYQFDEGLEYREVVMKMLGGGQCLGVEDCCAGLTGRMIQDDPVTEGTLKNGCQSLTYACADRLSYLFERDEKELDAMTRVLEFGMSGCALVNNDEDNHVDYWGGPETGCVLTASYHFSNEIVTGEATLHGVRR